MVSGRRAGLLNLLKTIDDTSYKIPFPDGFFLSDYSPITAI